MEITLITRNGITPNPTVEFLELCQKALDYISLNNFNDLLELESKFIDLCQKDSLLALDKYWVFGTLVITIQHATLGGDMQHRFCTHYDLTKGCTGTELSPVMYAY
jgi:hypothetical protein